MPSTCSRISSTPQSFGPQPLFTSIRVLVVSATSDRREAVVDEVLALDHDQSPVYGRIPELTRRYRHVWTAVFSLREESCRERELPENAR